MVVTLISSRTPRRIERGQAIKRFLPRKAKDFLHHKSASIEQNGGKLPFLRFRNRVSGKVGPDAVVQRGGHCGLARYATNNPWWSGLVFAAGDPDGADAKGGVPAGSAPDRRPDRVDHR